MSPLPPTREHAAGSVPHGSGSPYFGEPEPPRRSRVWLRRIGIVLLISLAVLLGAVAAVAYYAKGELDEVVKPKTAQMRQVQGQLEAALPGEPANILLLGSDHRKGKGQDNTQRSDTMLLIRLDPERGTISMLSFPRDLYVNIPGHGEDKINESYKIGGPELTLQTIKELTGLDINFAMNVDFTGFRGVVDELGGVWIDSDRTYFDNLSNQTSDIDIKPGYQLMNGRDALAFARFRHDNRGDFNRIARQQQVLDALKKQVNASFGPKQALGLFQLFKENADVAAGGGDEVPTNVLYNYLRLALKLDSKDIYQVEYAGDTGEVGPQRASVVLYDKETMDAAVAAYLAPSAKAREQTADQLVGKQAPRAEAAGVAEAEGDAELPESPEAPVVPEPSTVSVRVLNGSSTAGVARSMAQQLTQAGYQVDPSQSNADVATYANTRVQYATADDKPAADALASRISGATAQPKDDSNPFTTQLLVIVGKTGQQLEADDAGSVSGAEGGPSGGEQYEGNAVPQKSDPKVITDPDRARQYFMETSSERFTIMYPTVLEATSSFEEVYPYRILEGRSTVYDAYRLVAKTGEGDYWGLQGTSWADPPILQDPTREVVRGRRTYRLYFNGTKLHMVAWREGTGTYWVSNSPLNNLANETMLAIADGVKPLT